MIVPWLFKYVKKKQTKQTVAALKRPRPKQRETRGWGSLPWSFESSAVFFIDIWVSILLDPMVFCWLSLFHSIFVYSIFYSSPCSLFCSSIFSVLYLNVCIKQMSSLFCSISIPCLLRSFLHRRSWCCLIVLYVPNFWLVSVLLLPLFQLPSKSIKIHYQVESSCSLYHACASHTHILFFPSRG